MCLVHARRGLAHHRRHAGRCGPPSRPGWHPARRSQTAPFAVRRGGLTYEGRDGAEPLDAERVRWRMAYRPLDGDTVLAADAAEYEWWVLSADGLADELAPAGFSVSVDADLLVGLRPASPR